MKKVSYLLSALSVASLLTFSACNKDKDDAKPTLPSCKPIKITYGSNSYSMLEYNPQDKLVKFLDYGDGKLESETTIEYNTNGQATKVTSIDNGQLEGYLMLEYNSKGQLMKATGFDQQNSSDSYTTFEYDNNGNQIKATGYETEAGVMSTYPTEYEYANGNLVKSISKRGTPDEDVTTYEYYTDKEDKLKPLMDGPLGFFLGEGGTASKNMLKKKVEVTKSSGSSTTYTYTSDFTYEYNDKGFPVKQQENYKSNWSTSTSAYIYEYQCK